MNLFSVVRFPNNVCAGGNLNGTCYSAEECSSRGGVNGGSCAGGYGVCCTCKYQVRIEFRIGNLSKLNCSSINLWPIFIRELHILSIKWC